MEKEKKDKNIKCTPYKANKSSEILYTKYARPI